MAGEGEFPKSDGDILYDSDINWMALPIQQLYTGGDFNASVAGGSTGTSENSHELDAVASGDILDGMTYALIEITYTAIHTRVNAGSMTNSLKIQTKEIGEAYADTMGYKIVSTSGTTDGASTTTATIKYYHTLTAGEKSNGFQVKIFGKTVKVASDASTSGSVSNIQTVVILA